MKRLRKLLLTIFILSTLLAFWYWTDEKDYFKADYKTLTTAQQKIFKWQDDDDGDKLMHRYRQHFFDTQYMFPRQKVTTVKLFRNTPMVSLLTSKTLNQEYVSNFVQFCNDPTNFHWGETTWGPRESEYYCRLYNKDNIVVGKIYFGLEAGMTSSIPFSPAMKFGALSPKGLSYVKMLFSDNMKWK